MEKPVCLYKYSCYNFSLYNNILIIHKYPYQAWLSEAICMRERERERAKGKKYLCGSAFLLLCHGLKYVEMEVW